MASDKEERTIRVILRAASHFDALQLARPHADLLENPVWDVSDEQVSRAFRRLSLHCHPDKSQHPDAPRAFELLKKAKACLLDPHTREDYLIDYVKRAKTSWEGNWGLSGEAASVRQRTTSMRDQAREQQSEDVIDAMRERRERAEQAARKKERVQKARARQRERDERPLGDEDNSDDEMLRGAGGGPPATGASGSGRDMGSGKAAPSAVARAPKKRPKFM